MGIRYIRKHINEGMFKNPEQAKAAKERMAQRSNVDKLAASARAQIPILAEKNYTEKIKNALVGTPKESVFSNYNEATCNDIRFYLEGNVLICEAHVDIKTAGYWLNSGDIDIRIWYPETIRMLEEDLSEKYGIPCKFKIIVKKLFKKEIASIYSSVDWYISIVATNKKDLTDFCHFLNECEGLEHGSIYRLCIDRNRNYNHLKSFTSISTTEPLKEKFQGIKIIGGTLYDVERLSDIVSTEISDSYMQVKPLYKGIAVKTAKETNYTGYVEMFYEGKMVDSISYDKLKEVLIDCADFGNRHPEFKNICLYINIFGKWEFASYPTSGQPLYFGKEIRDLQNSSHRVTNISVILNLYNGNGRYPAFNQIAIEGKDYYKKREQ